MVELWLRAIPNRFAAHVAELRSNKNAARIFALKVALVTFLVTAAATISVITYNKLDRSEHKLFESRFNSVCDNAITSVTDSMNRMNLNVQELSVTYGHIFPTAAQWPNVAWKGFQPTAALLSNISSVGGMGIIPIVQPDQVQSYHSFISAYYDTDPYSDRFTYTNPYFPNGEIWNTVDSSTFPPKLYEDQFGNTTDSPYQILTPVSQYTLSSIVGPHSVSYNLHGDATYTNTIDMVIDCAAGKDYAYASTSCGTLSPAAPVPLPSPDDPSPTAIDMMAVFLQPIFPADNQSTLVGFAAGTFSWRALLTNIIPKDVSNVDCVIKADGKVFTFCIANGVPYFMGEGALEESAYADMSRSGSILGQHITVATGEPYVISFYPTREFERRYKTDVPVRGALVILCSFLLCAVLFGSYDFLLQREFHHSQAVLDTKRRFVRFISHEIRTPLNTVRLGMKLLELEMGKFAAVLSAGSTADVVSLVKAALMSYQQLADEIIESSESAVEVLNDLLNYDKIEIGTLKLDLSVFNFRDLVERTVTAMQVQAQQKGVALELRCSLPFTARAAVLGDKELPEDLEGGGDGNELLWTIIGDSARLGQVLRNLLSNALKFTPTDGNVSVSVTTSDALGGFTEKIRASSDLYKGVTHIGTLSIAVKDSGAGLSPQQLAEICAEGVQFNANELQAGQGSGLGLFISKGIIEQHGGQLVVESEGLGKGVTFTAELPLFRSTLQSSPVQSAPSSPSSAHRAASARSASDAAAPQSSCRLLVVDDSALNRKMIIRLLTSKGYRCEQAEDGEAGTRTYLEMVERGEPPDAILMDFEMPVMNGPSATARLRKLGCACLIVGVTGNVLSQDVAFFKEHGANAVLPKPIVLEDFERLQAEYRMHHAHNRREVGAAELGVLRSVRVKPHTQATAQGGAEVKIYPV